MLPVTYEEWGNPTSPRKLDESLWILAQIHFPTLTVDPEWGALRCLDIWKSHGNPRVPAPLLPSSSSGTRLADRRFALRAAADRCAVSGAVSRGSMLNVSREKE